MTTETMIAPTSTLEEVLARMPTAGSDLFQQYGIDVRGISPSVTLEDICAGFQIAGVGEVVEYLQTCAAWYRDVLIGPQDLANRLRIPDAPRLLDVRTAEEREMASIEGSELVTAELASEIETAWPKETPIVLYCHVGARSLSAASYLKHLGFRNVRSLDGGIEKWSIHVDSKVPRYREAPSGGCGSGGCGCG